MSKRTQVSVSAGKPCAIRPKPIPLLWLVDGRVEKGLVLAFRRRSHLEVSVVASHDDVPGTGRLVGGPVLHRVLAGVHDVQSGEGGIRTLGELAPTLVFETSTIGHSVTSPAAGHRSLADCSGISRVGGGLVISPWSLVLGPLSIAVRSPQDSCRFRAITSKVAFAPQTRIFRRQKTIQKAVLNTNGSNNPRTKTEEQLTND